MCGLTGFWQPDGGAEIELRQRVRRMADTLVHRGPDDSGEWVDASAGLALGFRRLSIVDLSPAGHQPMASSDGRFVIAFNGEIYNYRDLRADLDSSGVRFRGTSDTEVIVELMARRGVAATLPAIWGMFAMAIWDADARILWLARDRLGKKPLYYGRGSDGTWMFGSELKSLRAHPACPSRIDRGAVVSLLRYACIPAPHSIYEGIAKLPPGHVAKLDSRREPVVEAYWRARTVIESSVAARRAIGDAEAIEACEHLMRDAVRRRMVADVPVGAFLSGGVDSTAVVALMQAESTRPVRTFSIGFTEAAYDEAPAAAAVAAHLGTDHTEFYVSPARALEVVPRLPVLYDEPFADSSQIPTAVVSALAREHVTVALTGDGGDEMFGGYPRQMLADQVWRRVQRVPAYLRGPAAGILGLLSPSVLDPLYAATQRRLPGHARQRQAGDKARKLGQFLTAGTVDELYDILLSHWDRPERAVPGVPEPVPWSRREAAGAALPTVAERVMFQDLIGFLADDILVKVDRASMGASLELRAPLLDHRMVELTWGLPLSFRFRDGRGKWLLRQVLARHVPASLIERPKSGFTLPVGEWLRGPMREWAESLLAPRVLADDDIFDASVVRETWSRHLAGRREELRLWPVLMFQAWRAAWTRPPAPRG